MFDDTVADDELPSVYRSADLVVLPSLDRSEAFGIVLIEALASGVPVVASDLPGVRSIIENGRNGFTFETGDSADLAAKITLCLGDENLRLRMASAARAVALSRYRQADLWVEIDRIMRKAAS